VGRRGAVVLLAAIVASAAQAATAPPRFDTKVVARAAKDGFLSEIGIADVTGDGIPDIVGTRIDQTYDLHPLVVLAGDGRGGFKDVTTKVFDGPVPGTQHARQIVFADFNGDKRTDIYVADHGYDAPPFPGHPDTLVLSEAGGKLVDASRNLPQQSGFTHSAAAGDVNGDGAIDIYAGNLSSATSPAAEILLNDGSGRFALASDALPAFMTAQYTAPHVTREAFADVNSDGSQDLILASAGSLDSFTWGPSRVLLNDGHGHFSDLPNALPPKPYGDATEGLAVTPVELNGDGHIDLLIGYSRLGGPGERFYASRFIQVLINNGDGTFRDETASRLPQTVDNREEWPYAIRVGDLNRDGKPDIEVSLSAEQPNEHPPLYLNDGTGRFTPLAASAFRGGFPFAMIDVADANRDGRLDVVSATPNYGASTDELYAVSAQAAKPKPKPKKHGKHP
jgi:hypothetical protein